MCVTPVSKTCLLSSEDGDTVMQCWLFLLQETELQRRLSEAQDDLDDLDLEPSIYDLTAPPREEGADSPAPAPPPQSNKLGGGGWSSHPHPPTSRAALRRAAKSLPVMSNM